jgi:amidase
MTTTVRTSTRALNDLTATEIAARLDAGSVTCEAVARACLDRIAEREPVVHAWAHLEPDRVIADARALDRGPRRGPLHGVPFGVKDIIDTADLPTEYGSPIHKGHRPARDAACVALSRKAGGLLLGKTVTTEFANVTPGPTRHPLDPARTPGGSSSGSGAAVADRMVPLALGTQTTGSTTRPASFCGVFGYRPTWGDLRVTGVMEASGSLDTLGILARSVEDVSLYRDVLLGIEHRPLPDGSPPRIGFPRPYFWERLDAATRRLLEDAAKRLARAGAQVEDVQLPEGLEALEDAHRWISGFEMARNLAWEVENHREKISEAFREGRLRDGAACTYERYTEMRRVVEQCRQRLAPVMERCDVLLAPAAQGEAPAGWHPVPHPWVYMAWTAMQVPSITLPVFEGPSGLPIGAQLIGRKFDDRRMLAAGRWVYRVLRD